MDLRQIEYIVQIADECSITKAAEKMFISQSGMNQQLLKLEAELGTPLFHRCKNNLLLTEAGKVYVDYGRQILHLKKEAYDVLNDIGDNNVGSLSIGLTPERGINMLISVYPEFHKRFPHITIEPQEIGVRRQQSLISKGYLDLGFVTLNDADKTGDEYIHIYYEDILLAVPRRHPLARNANPPGEPFAVADLKEFKEEYFVLMFKNSTMRSVIDPLFKESGFMPKLLFETASNRTMCNLVKNNMACSLLTFNYAKEQDDVAYFYLPGRPRWELCATYKKEHYLTQAARTFIALAIDHYRNTALKIGQPVL